MSKHPSVTVCEMCGVLIGDRDLHNAFHVKLADHDRNVLAVIDQNVDAVNAVAAAVDLQADAVGVLFDEVRAWDDD